MDGNYTVCRRNQSDMTKADIEWDQLCKQKFQVKDWDQHYCKTLYHIAKPEAIVQELKLIWGSPGHNEPPKTYASPTSSSDSISLVQKPTWLRYKRKSCSDKMYDCFR